LISAALYSYKAHSYKKKRVFQLTTDDPVYKLQYKLKYKL